MQGRRLCFGFKRESGSAACLCFFAKGGGLPFVGFQEKKNRRRSGWAWQRDGFFLGLGFSLFVHPPLNFLRPHPCKFFSPHFFHCSMLFIGEVLLGLQTSPSTFPFLFFSFFFINFDFSYFFVFLKASNINVNSIRKISDHKIYALKVERVPNSFENLNSFEMTLKMLKTMQIYQKCIFWGFHCFFAIFWFFL